MGIQGPFPRAAAHEVVLPVARHTHLCAHIEQRARGTLRCHTSAYMLAERHQQGVDFYPIAPRQFFLEYCYGPLRRGRLHITPAVGDAVDGNIHADGMISASD